MSRRYGNLWSWFWPAAIARRLWLTIAASTAYTAGVYIAFPDHEWGGAWVTVVGLIDGMVLGVLVGFRTKAAYDRWWEGRCLWGELTNHSRNLCLKAARLVDPPADERRELFRLVSGFPLALMKHLREGLTLRDVPGFEADPATPAHVPAELAGRVYALLARWRAAGRIDGFGQLALDAHAVALMNVCGACEKVRHTPLPVTYLVLLRHGLVLSFLFVPWHLTQLVGGWAVLVQAVVVYFLLGIELTAEELEQPFGHDPDDLPLETYCLNIRRNAAEILSVQ
ncbi:MAG TPA: bestrophin family ion channel [Urbifossiella sp.]|jgi:putative membrane protein|nr:bestrophin family ion channel [Urbifossiella sp.]